jgi:hypothetical protein
MAPKETASPKRGRSTLSESHGTVCVRPMLFKKTVLISKPRYGQLTLSKETVTLKRF